MTGEQQTGERLSDAHFSALVKLLSDPVAAVSNLPAAERLEYERLHMLRAMDLASTGDWPFASADSTNIARNHAGNVSRSTPAKGARGMADRIDSLQAPALWRVREHTIEMAV